MNKYFKWLLILLLITVAFVILAGYFLIYRLFSYPWYPYTAEAVSAIEGYQSQIADNRYDMGDNRIIERFASQHLLVQGNLLYAAQCGLTIFDITLPEKISVVGNYQDVCGVDDLVVVNERAYLTWREKGVTVLDVTNSTEPTLLGVYEYNAGAYAPPFGVAVVGDFIYLQTTAPKLPNDDTANAKAEERRYLPEQLRWQMIKMEADRENFQLIEIGHVDDLGKPVASNGRYIYTATNWHRNSLTGKTYLQTIEPQSDGTLKVVDEQVIDSEISDWSVSGETLFGSVGHGVEAWDIANPAKPSKLDSTYNTFGRIGDFATFEANDSYIVGEGYSLSYERQPDTVRMKVFARIPSDPQNIDCNVWLNLDDECKLPLIDKSFRGVDFGRGSALSGKYVFYPYNIATGSSDKGLYSCNIAILVFKLP